jgi:hypothetical protein
MHFVEDTPTAVLVRQVLGAVVEFEKTTLVAKLAAARRRRRMATGEKLEGRKSHPEARPDVVRLARALARRTPKGGRLSLRAISAELAARGVLNQAAGRSTQSPLPLCSLGDHSSEQHRWVRLIAQVFAPHQREAGPEKPQQTLGVRGYATALFCCCLK